MTKHIIGLCGDKFHGKDTFADALCNLHGFERFAFANPLKESAAAAFGRPTAEFHDVALKETPIPGWPNWTYRKVLEWLGTDVYRKEFPGIWWKSTMAKIDASAGTKFVITDVRFQDEEKAVRERGGKLIRIVNPRVAATPADPQECETLGLHPSMWTHHTFNVDLVVQNDGTVHDLRNRALMIYQQLFGGA